MDDYKRNLSSVFVKVQGKKDANYYCNVCSEKLNQYLTTCFKEHHQK